MTAHRHRAVPARSHEYCWQYCVTLEECAAHPHRQAAHGNIVRIDVCSCGAERAAEVNIARSNYGPWRGVAG
jgi:hypothetical protein